MVVLVLLQAITLVLHAPVQLVIMEIRAKQILANQAPVKMAVLVCHLLILPFHVHA